MQAISATPAFHPKYPLGTKVRLKQHLEGHTGILAGIANVHPELWHYIVLLDQPIENEDGTHRAISWGGTLMEPVGEESGG